MRWIILVLMLALCVQALNEAGWDARIDAEAQRQLDSVSSESSSSSSESSSSSFESPVETSSILPECPSEVTVNTYFSNCEDLRTKNVNEYCYNTSHAYFKFSIVYLPVWGHSAETDNRAGSYLWNNEETIQRNDPIKSTHALKKELFEKILLTKEAYPSIGGTFVEDGTKMFVKQGAEWHMVESVTFGTPNETNGLTKTDQSIGFNYTTRAACPSDVTMLEGLAQQEPVQDSDSGYSSTQIESITTSTYPTCTYCSMLDEAWYIAGNSQVYVPGTGLVAYTTVYPPVSTFSGTSSSMSSSFSSSTFTTTVGGKAVYGASTTCTADKLVKGQTGNSRLNTYASKWSKALEKAGLKGITWIGVMNHNGKTDDTGLSVPGRLTIIFAPCTTNFNNPIEVMYYWHGDEGFHFEKKSGYTFDDFNLRLAPQSKKMSGQGRNFVLIFPEMAYSGGDTGMKNQGGRSINSRIRELTWTGDDTLMNMHNEALGYIRDNMGNPNIGLISIVGHSKGGLPLKLAANSGQLKELAPGKITFSDSDYFDASRAAWDNYVKDNNDVELNLIAQDPSSSSAQHPTYYTINFLKDLDDPITKTWSISAGDRGTQSTWTVSTPGATKGQVYTLTKYPNVNYYPSEKDHYGIGAMSLSFVAPSRTIGSTGSCSEMVDKLYLAAQDMKSWNRNSWNNPDPCENNACCGMNEQVSGSRACSVGIPNSPCGSAFGCCGAYIWHLFDIAIHKYGVPLTWPYKGVSSGDHPNSFWPANMQGVQNIRLREKSQVVGGNPDVHSNLKPGDLLYLQWENNGNQGCEYDSHVLLVGKPKGDSFEYIDSVNIGNGVSRKTVRQYLDYRQECGEKIQRKDSPRVQIWRSPLCK